MRKLLWHCFVIFPAATFLIWYPRSSSAIASVAEITGPGIPKGLRVSGPPSKSVTAIAHGVSVIPGAVVCSDSQTVGLVAHLYEQAWQDQLEAKMTRGQSSLIHGSPAEIPHPDEYGCILVPPGTKVMLESGNFVPVVTLKLHGGWARGVTFPNMLFVPPSPPTPEHQKGSAEVGATHAEIASSPDQPKVQSTPLLADHSQPAPIERPDPDGKLPSNEVRRARDPNPQNYGTGDLPIQIQGSRVKLNESYEILSDPQGVDFQPYLQSVLRQIFAQWVPAIPEEARPPLLVPGSTLIRFTIAADGTVTAMHLDGSTHDDLLNRAAWATISNQRFPALPPEFHGPDLVLRVSYTVNKQ